MGLQLLPQVPNPQGLSSRTFVTPPIDGSLTIAEVFDFNAEHSPEHPYFIYEDQSTHDIVPVTWKSLRNATRRVARIVHSYDVPPASRIIGILALVDTVSYFTLIHGIIRAGYIPFPLSPRNSPAAIAHLLAKTGVTHMFVSEDPSMQGLSAGSLKVLAGQGGQRVDRLPTPFFDELYQPQPEEDARPLPDLPKADLSAPGVILHSSGSTSFPKPITITHRILVEWMRIPSYGEVDLCGEYIGAAALPMFHALGVINSTSMVSCGGILGVFQPVRQPPFPTPERLIQSVATLHANVLFTLPVFLEAWSHNPEHIAILKQCRAVIFSGGPLSRVIGDALAAEGVRLMQVFGITEIGAANVYIPKYVDPQDWEWFSFSKAYQVVLIPQDDSDAVEFQVVPCETHTPAVLNTIIEGKDAYNTNDLLLPHPTKPGYYKVHGRVDDQIMLSTGEKTNPGPLEAIISKDPLIAGAVMFGRGRAQNGIIIQPAPSLGVDVTNPSAVSTYIDSIWPSIKLANAYAPSHSRLFREMIVLAIPSKPFTFTGKGSIRKSAVVTDYADQVEAAYAAVEAGTSANVDAPATWTKETATDFVRAVVLKVLESSVGDNDDFFHHGADSLQSAVIRNSIVNALKADKIDTSAIPPNFVYEAPTIIQLGLAVHAITDPSSSSASDKIANKVAEITGYVEKYSTNFPTHSASAPAPTSEVILLTGSTGALGTTLLSQLVETSSVSRIYALNRKTAGKTVKQRQVEALLERGYDVTIAGSPKVVFVETDASGVLGIPTTLYDEIRTTTTAILHTAWRVDFNLSVASFEPLIQGLRGLVDLALQSPLPTPPRLVFASSISVFGDWHSSTPAPEAPIEDPKIAVGNGYGESKWVSEMILDRAARQTALRPVVVRIGQLSGGENGSWNTAEWVPSVVRSGEVVRALPSSSEEISWVPLKTAAAAIIDFRNAPSGIVHLAHPHPTTWNTIFGPIAAALGVPLVPYLDWLNRLEADLADPSRTEVEAATANPALRLISMFRPFRNGAAPSEAREAMGLPKLLTTEAVKHSPALRWDTLEPLGQSDALRWVQYWQKAGLLKTKLLKNVETANVSDQGRSENGRSNPSSNPYTPVFAVFAVACITFAFTWF